MVDLLWFFFDLLIWVLIVTVGTVVAIVLALIGLIVLYRVNEETNDGKGT